MLIKKDSGVSLAKPCWISHKAKGVPRWLDEKEVLLFLAGGPFQPFSPPAKPWGFHYAGPAAKLTSIVDMPFRFSLYFPPDSPRLPPDSPNYQKPLCDLILYLSKKFECIYKSISKPFLLFLLLLLRIVNLEFQFKIVSYESCSNSRWSEWKTYKCN